MVLPMGSKKQSHHAGFAVLTLVLLLSLASLIYTVNMTQTQLIDNQILSNDYRTQAARLHAESGVSLVESQLKQGSDTKQLLHHLPFVYPTVITDSELFQVQLSQSTDQLLHLTSTGYSEDRQAIQRITLTLQRQADYGIPASGLASNAALALNVGATIQRDDNTQVDNDLGLALPLIHAASLTTAACPDRSPLGLSATSNLPVAQSGLSFAWLKNRPWGAATSFAGTFLDSATPIPDKQHPHSLFEKTFGVSMREALPVLNIGEGVTMIKAATYHDQTMSCAQQLQSLDDRQQVLYIQGDCDLTRYSAPYVIGSVTYPKLIFMEGGRFVNHAGVKITGLLYYLPKQSLSNGYSASLASDAMKTLISTPQAINLTGLSVNGALLTEYACSFNEQVNEDASLWVNYNPEVLTTLYQQIGVSPINVEYQQVLGSWRDF